MRRSVLLAFACAALVAAPQAWADEQHHPDQGHEAAHGQQKGGRHPGPSSQGQHPGPGAQHQAPHFQQGPPQGPHGQPQGGWGGQPRGEPQGEHQGPHPTPRFQQGPAEHGQPQGGWAGRPGGQAQPAYRGPQAGHWNGRAEQRFDRRANPEQWAQTRHGWRGAHEGWNRSGVWRGGRDWWRGRPEFRGYAGPHVGFWFIPGVGYWQVPREYWGRQWGAGDYLPRAFWRYQVYDWQDYGLPPPPFGCAWVWIDGGVALVDLSDGYILDIEYGLW